MKTKLFIAFFLLFTGVASAQIRQNLGGAPNIRNFVRGTIEGDSGIVLKTYPDTVTASLGPVIKKIDGLLIRIKDSIFFRDTLLKRWVNLTAVNKGALIAPGVDSITFKSNQLCQWKNSISKCYPLAQFFDSTAINYNETKYINFNNGVAVDSVSIKTGVNIGTTNLTLTGRRTLNGNNTDLIFNNLRSFQVWQGSNTYFLAPTIFQIVHNTRLQLNAPVIELTQLSNSDTLTRFVVRDGAGRLFFRNLSSIILAPDTILLTTQARTTAGLVIRDAAIQKNADSIAAHNIRIGANTTNIATNTFSITLKEPLIIAPNTPNKVLNGYKIFVGLNTDSMMEGIKKFSQWANVTGGIRYSAGNVVIGTGTADATLNVAGSFKYVTGLEGANKILTSDVNGLASWQAPGAAPAGVTVLTDVVNIATYSGNDSLLIIRDVKRGGNFTRFFGTSASDNGVIFTDGAAKQWKRIINTNYINLNWYGPVLTTLPDNDIFAKLTAAIAASLNSEIITTGSVYIPPVQAGNQFFYCSAQIVINAKVKIFGDGSTKSHIRWNSNVGGFYTNYVTSRNTEISGILLSAYGRTGLKGGIEFKDIIHCTDVTVQEFGMGFIGVNGIPTGNSNNSTFTRCIASQNSVHGYYFKGSDANAMKIIDCEAVSNGGLGVCDQSFLGNHYYGLHAATNGGPDISWQKGLVKVGTLVYACIYDNTLNISPGVTAGWQNYWYQVLGTTWNAFPAVLDYSAATNYYAVGSWNLDGFAAPPLGTGQNQFGSMVACYMEYDQAAAYLGPRCTGFGGANQYRIAPASLEANINSLFTRSVLYAGNTPGSGLPTGMLSANEVGVFLNSLEKATIAYEPATKSTILGNDRAIVFSGQTTNAMAGRNTGISTGLGLRAPLFLTSTSSRSVFNKLDVSRGMPGNNSGLDVGDMYLATGQAWYDFKPEAIIVKNQVNNVGATKNMLIKGFMEEVITGASGTYSIYQDYNIAANRGILYDVEFVGSDATNDCMIHREVLITKRAGAATIINNTATIPDYVPGTFGTVAFNFAISGEGDDVTLQLVNLPAGTNGKVNIKRIDY